MRTYVGKTDEQIKALQVATPEEQVAAINEFLPSPVSQNPERAIIEPSRSNEQSPPATVPAEIIPPLIIEKFDSNNTSSDVNENKQIKKKSLFDRLFKKDKNK